MYKNTILCILSLLLIAFFAFPNLVESPPTWMDEGIIIQVAKNMAEQGIHGIQVAPGEFVSAGFVSTGYPVTLPISLVYRMFGAGLFQARVVMVFFIFVLIILAYLFTRKILSPEMASFSVFLLASFGPVYGHGKNVLGEIPGLMYLFFALLVFTYIDTHKSHATVRYIFSGLFFGLTVACKPIFILLIPALGVTFLLYRKDFASKRGVALFGMSFLVPIFVWLFVQFSGDSFVTMFAIYANPHNTDVYQSILANMKRFVTEPQPFYALEVFIVWVCAIATRIKTKSKILFSEATLFAFAILVMCAYLRTVGYYRYFFLAEFISLLYLPQSLLIIWPKKVPKPILYGGIIFLVLFQIYQTQFHSFTSDSRMSVRSHELELFAQSIPTQKSLFVYQVPELVTFLKDVRYYQYMDVTTTIHIGGQSIPKLLNGTADIVFVNRDIYQAHPELFGRYGNGRYIDRYVALSVIK
ncbi:MAG: hypothetical protein RLZZ347_453 [Candidatus Parcubacteria bacterium]|jgi:4-amino-4-deoxy-L-arabinose transferase-like glycosyltransferase